MTIIGVVEASKRLGVSARRVRALITSGKLTATKLGREWAIDEKDLQGVVVYGRSGRPLQKK